MASPVDFGKVVNAAKRTISPGPVTEEVLDGMEQTDVAMTLNYLLNIRDKNMEAANQLALRRTFWTVFLIGACVGSLVTLVLLGAWLNPIEKLANKLDQASAAQAILEAVRKGK